MTEQALGLVLRKCGMTRIYGEDGKAKAVTVLKTDGNRVVRVKTDDADGYASAVVTWGKASRRANKPELGVFAKAEASPGEGIKEFRASAKQLESLEQGAALNVDQFEIGEAVDVRSVSKGKGFAGTIKRWNFAGQDRTHGNSINHRTAGSIGQCQDPGRVFKGKKMAGQMGNKNVTVQNLIVVDVDAERGYLIVNGGVPGAPGATVEVKPSVKKKGSS